MSDGATGMREPDNGDLSPVRGVAAPLRLVAYSGMRNEVVAPESWREPLRLFAQVQVSAGRTRSSVKLRDYHLRRFASRVGRPPFDVTADDLAAHLATRGWSRNTKRAVRASMRAFYAWATATERMAKDPARTLLPVTPDAGKPRPAADAAIDSALLHAGPDVSLMIRLAAYAGLRCCEIAKVHSDHVSARPSPDGTLYSLRIAGKGEKVRVVPIPSAVAHELTDRDGLAFPGQIEGHLSAGYVSKLISAQLPEGVTSHMLRHRFASKAYAGSKNLRAVQELLGHATISTTQVYTYVDDDELRKAAAWAS